MNCPHCSSEKVIPECHFKVQYASVGGIHDDIAISWHCEGCTLRFYLFRSECRSELKRLIKEHRKSDANAREDISRMFSSNELHRIWGES